MSRTAFMRILLAACAGLLSMLVLLTATGAPAPVRAGIDPVSNTGVRLQQPSSTGILCFVVDGVVSCVDRVGFEIQSGGTLTDQVRFLMQGLIAGPTSAERAQGVRSSLPAGTTLADVSASNERTTIRLDLPAAFLQAIDASDAEDVNQQIATTLTPFNIGRIDVEARDPAQPKAFHPLSSFLPPVAIPTKPGEINLGTPASTPSVQSGQPPQNGQPQSRGGLNGRTVFVSAGHGWYWLSSQSRYRTQRPVYPNAPYAAGEGIVEDLNNAEVVNQYLLQYLWNAGADAWTVRERDMVTAMQIVDDVSPFFSTEGNWLTGASGGYNGTYRYATTVTSGGIATATWTFTPATRTEYAVYVWFPNASNRTAAARYTIEHAGGTTVITLTQQRDGMDWRYIGTYPFRGGAARIRVSNRSTTAGQVVLADAIRIGGGVGDVSVAGAPVSGKPRWEEQARQYAKWVGLPDADNLNDVIVRPIYSEWEKESGEDSVYLSWHTNGYNGYNTTARGTSSYIHSFEPTTNSDRLQYWVHTELLNDIRTGWEATWPDQGRRSLDLGELRLLDSMPGVLLENGYHDNPTDVEAQKDPRFNLLSARAVYQGLVRYWHEQDPNVPLVFLPEPPARLRVRNSGPSRVTLEWQSGPVDGAGLLGDTATSYRVYTSTDGFGWGDAISTAATALTLSNLTPGQLIYVRVTGVNLGGESFPTPILAARVASADVAPVLVVYGFDRIDRRGLVQQNDPPEGNSRRMFVDRINRYDYIIQHATGITHGFDSAVHAAVTEGEIGLGNYTIVDWIAGEEQAPDVSLNAADQALLQAFLDGGGALLISGSEIGYDLDFANYGRSFYNNTLHAQFTNDDAATHTAIAVAGEVFAGLGTFQFDDGTHGTYDVDWPDVFAPTGAARSVLVYNVGGTAALSYASGSCTRLIYMGFPLETIHDQSVRLAVLSRATGFLDDCVTLIESPVSGTSSNAIPPFTGITGGASTLTVQVAILSGTQYYNGSSFVSNEIWLTATGNLNWSYSLPALPDGNYTLKARVFQPDVGSGGAPAVSTFTLDRVPPNIPALMTPTANTSVPAFAVAFSWTGGGDPSGFIFELDGVQETLNSPVLSVTRIVTEGLHIWRVRAFDLAGNYSGWSAPATFNAVAVNVYLPIVFLNFTAEPPSGPNCYEAITNGGFEAGLSGWTTPSFTPMPSVTNLVRYEGSNSVRIGSAVTSTGVITQLSFSSVQQTVGIPANAISAMLALQRYRISGDTSGDLQYGVVISGTRMDYLVYDRVNDPAWQASQFDLLEYAGRAIDIRFSVKNDGNAGATGMYIDAVSLQICTP